MARATRAHCDRCARQVEVVLAPRGYVWAKRAWFAGLAVLVVLAPIIMSEITLLLPLAMVFAMAAGPLFALASQIDTCRECGAQIAKTRDG